MSAAAGVAVAYVAPHTIYAATQEFGGVHVGKPFMWLWVRYIGPGEVLRAGLAATHSGHTGQTVHVYGGLGDYRERHLVRAAAQRFMAVVWGE